MSSSTPNIVVPGQQVKLKVARDGVDVVFQFEDRVYRVPYKSALQLSVLIRNRATEAEEEALAVRIIEDGAILLRSGAPFGITDNPKIKEEIVKEASWNKTLRTSMAGGVKSKEIFGKPNVLLGPAPTGDKT